MAKTRSLIVLTVLVMLALLAAACAAPAAPAPAAPAAEAPAAEAPAQEAAPAAEGDKVTLTIESWRNDDLAIWQDMIIPAFNAKYPNIEVIFSPSAPAEYNAALNTKL